MDDCGDLLDDQYANVSSFIVSKIRKFFFTIFNLPSWRVEPGGADGGPQRPLNKAQHGGATQNHTMAH